MEIPTHLKNLYRHWQFHVQAPEALDRDSVVRKNAGGGAQRAASTSNDDVLMKKLHSSGLFRDIRWFISERISIWKQKTSGMEPPFTDDSILAQYRFCNIFREFDRQTIEFHELLAPLRGDLPLWLLNMFYCRMVARPETVRTVGLLSFNKDKNAEFYKRFMESSRPRFGTPYVFPVSTIQRSATPTRELFIAQHLPSVMRSVAREIQGWRKKPVVDGLAAIIPIFGFNHHFLWTEVLIDVAYQYPERIDLFGAFPIGPGSRPTMERIAREIQGGRTSDIANSAVVDPDVLPELLSQARLETGLTYNGTELRLSAENWEGIGCEFRKYTNLKSGKGRKRTYRK